MPRSYRLTVECLEDRIAPATYGIAWPDPGRLTLSFVPDGTSVAGSPSVLFQTLNAQELAQHPKLTSQQATQQWQLAVLRAFQTWAVNANINVGLVPDDGEPLGTAGPPQGDPHFGDIRIAMVPLGSQAPGDLVAFSQPYSPLAGTWAGDVELNSSYFGSGSGYDIFSVLLHEAGHVFGFPDTTTDPSSVMYRSYVGVRTGLSAGDIAMLQSLYGVRQADASEPNESQATAASITPGSASSVDSRTGLLVMDGDLTAVGETDYFQYTVTGKTGGSFTIALHTSGVSLLVPRLTVYDAGGKFNQSEQTSEANLALANGDLTISVPNAKAGDTYYIQIQGASDDFFRIGSYQLELAAGTTWNGPNNHSANGGNHGQGSGPPVTNLQPKIYTTDNRFDYAVQGTLASSTQIDLYSFHSPRPTDGLPTVMTATVWGTQPGGLQPQLTLEDRHGNPLPVPVLVNQDGTYTFQLPNAPANTKYFLAVQAEAPNGAHGTGNYFLGIDFGTKPIQLNTLVANQVVDAANPQQTETLHILRTQLFHLVFTATGAAGQSTVYDSQGNRLGTMTADNGQTVTANFILKPGLYTIQTSRAPGASVPMTYSLQYQEVSDAIGPEAIDTTLDPGPTTTTGLPYWWQTGYSAFLGLVGGTAGSTTGGAAPGTPTTSEGAGKPVTGSAAIVASSLSGPAASNPSAVAGNNTVSGLGGSASNHYPVGILSGPFAGLAGPASGSGTANAPGETANNPGLATVPTTPGNAASPATAGNDRTPPPDTSGTVVVLQGVVRINAGFGPFPETLAPSQTATAIPADTAPSPMAGAFDADRNGAIPSGALPLGPYALERAKWFTAQAVEEPEDRRGANFAWLYACLLLGLGVYPLVRQFSSKPSAALPDRDAPIKGHR